MAYLYNNFLGGQISDNPLSNVATTINSASFANLPAISGVNRMWLVLDPEGANGNPEIVLVSAHTASATSVTVLRGQQTGLGGFAAREHATATEWVHAATAQDLVSLLGTLLTAKGDLPTISASNTPARVPVGTDGLPLTADSAQTTGLAYAQLDTAGIADDAVTVAKLADDAKEAAGITRVGGTLARVANQSIAAASVVTISWDTESLDPQGFITVPGTTLTLPSGTGGLYAINLRVVDQAVAHGSGAYLLINAPAAVPYYFAPNGTDVLVASMVIPLAAGSTIDASFRNETANAVNIKATLGVHRVSL